MQLIIRQTLLGVRKGLRTVVRTCFLDLLRILDLDVWSDQIAMLVSLMVLPLICCIQRRLIRPCRHIMEVMILIACAGRPLRQV